MAIPSIEKIIPIKITKQLRYLKIALPVNNGIAKAAITVNAPKNSRLRTMPGASIP